MKENKKVLVSGCYDGVHDGQKYFLEIAATYGLLFVSIATDKTIIDLKSDGNENFELLTTQEERLKEIGDMDWVHEAFISTGMGEFNFLDDLERIKPNILLVNKDGDSEAKRDLCIKHNMEYVVLERIPRPGSLPITSTQLREEKKLSRKND